MKRKFFFLSGDNHRLCGILSDPVGNKDRPLILLCHGLATGKDGRTCVSLENMLNRKRFATFRFDLFGHGESAGDFADLTISEAADDVRSALRFVKDSGYRRIGLVGSSFGGFASILTAGRTHDLFVLALKSPVTDYLGLLIARDQGKDCEDWKRTGHIVISGPDGQARRLNYTFYEDAAKIRADICVRKISVPTLIVHGDRDETVPLSQSLKANRLIPDCRLRIIQGADHMYSDPEHYESMLGLISDFIVRQGHGGDPIT